MAVHYDSRPSIFELKNSAWTVHFRSSYNTLLFIYIHFARRTLTLTGDLPFSHDRLLQGPSFLKMFLTLISGSQISN